MLFAKLSLSPEFAEAVYAMAIVEQVTKSLRLDSSGALKEFSRMCTVRI